LRVVCSWIYCFAGAGVLAFALLFSGRALAAGDSNAVTPVTARDFYNAGTELLAAKKFSEAEQMFQSALAAQNERVQPPALYNLGQARFDDGMAALKKGPSGQSLTGAGNTAGLVAGQAIERGETALAENDLSKMITAYLAGRGARHELKAIEKAVRKAMDTYGDTLSKWQRAEDDFKSAAELNPADTNAARNAEIVAQYIARLVDSLRQMQRMAATLVARHSRLNDVLRQLGSRIPKQNLPAGGDGDDDDEGLQPESLRGLKEGVSQSGKEFQVPLSPDEAAQILNGISLDGGRRLPMNEAKNGESSKKSGLTW
jgi:tetratricopeptide (TPR) repeat protein